MTARIAGCDLGKASASFVIAETTTDGTLRVVHHDYVLHEGKPMDALRQWYREQKVYECTLLGATGAYADELVAPAMVFPEDSCQEAALDLDPTLPGELNLVSIGARGYSVLARSETRANGSSMRHVQFLENDKCSSGAGENVQRMAARFGLSVEEADRLAAAAEREIPITARCSVFAKSEITHFANQGKPAAELLRGYFSSIARNARALLARNETSGPVYLIGGGARIESLRAALERCLGRPVTVPQGFLYFEALGAAALAWSNAPAEPAPLPRDPGELIRPRPRRFSVHPPASAYKDRVTHLPELDPAPLSAPSVLGLDLGSTGAKAMLAAVADGRPIADVYDRTRGNPVDAARRLVAALLEQGRPDVRAVAITGSGREAVATLVRTVFPELGERLVVLNEIVAHARAAIRCDRDGGRDLSVIEIGGQDAKYIRISEGRIVESDMNKACSAGTGSFLEEQANFYDVHDIGKFVEMAAKAERPPDLGQMCTVYVAEAAGEAIKEGFSLSDVFAGFQYSVINNYLSRVMGQRTLGRTVFFQGKPASNPSLAWTLAAVTGRDIVVPPNPGAMGAWGIALCAIDALGAERLMEAPGLDVARILVAEVSERSEFQCKDPACQTMCPIERTTIRLGNERRVAISGGACPKFEVAAGPRRKLDLGAPNPFEARRELLQRFAAIGPARGSRRSVAIPAVGALAGHVPWLATLVRELGFTPRVLEPQPSSLAAGEQLCNSFDSCGPAKITHAVCDAECQVLLFPKIRDISDTRGPGGQTCVTEQAMPEIVEQSLKARGRTTRVVRPLLSFAGGLESGDLLEAAAAIAEALGAPRSAARRAAGEAARAQREYEAELERLGREALAWARERGIP
ncbi:MAG: hypothetical protein D6815_01585, partial [Candidatus Dadabacteria bacterium]